MIISNILYIALQEYKEEIVNPCITFVALIFAKLPEKHVHLVKINNGVGKEHKPLMTSKKENLQLFLQGLMFLQPIKFFPHDSIYLSKFSYLCKRRAL